MLSGFYWPEERKRLPVILALDISRPARGELTRMMHVITVRAGWPRLGSVLYTYITTSGAS